MEIVKPLQSQKVTTITVQMQSNSSYTIFKNYRPATGGTSKTETAAMRSSATLWRS